MTSSKKRIVIVIFLLLLVILIYIYRINCLKQVPLTEQIVNLNEISLSNYERMGEIYSDQIYEKYDVVKFGHYKDTEFILEPSKPMEWIILNKEKDKVLLLSKYIIDCKAFNGEEEDLKNIESISIDYFTENNPYKTCNWETSTLRKWLNKDFFNKTFNYEEQKSVINSRLDNYEFEDKIFCLSEDEYKKYFDNNNYYENKRDIGNLKLYYNGATKRIKRAQKYDEFNFFESDDTYWYWLRDVGEPKKSSDVWCATTKIIGQYGDISQDINIDIFCGVRPAMWVSLE